MSGGHEVPSEASLALRGQRRSEVHDPIAVSESGQRGMPLWQVGARSPGEEGEEAAADRADIGVLSRGVHTVEEQHSVVPGTG